MLVSAALGLNEMSIVPKDSAALSWEHTVRMLYSELVTQKLFCPGWNVAVTYNRGTLIRKMA